MRVKKGKSLLYEKVWERWNVIDISQEILC